MVKITTFWSKRFQGLNSIFYEKSHKNQRRAKNFSHVLFRIKNSISKAHKSFKTPHGVQCTTPNVIYLLTCNICRKQYVGETKRPFVIRLKEHLADIRLKRDKPVAVHINSHNSETKSVIPQIIEVIRRDPELHATTELRKKREVSWIYRL